MHRVMIHPASYDTCRKSVDQAFELFPQTIAQKKVLIKPNVLRTSRTDEHIVTHPALLRAVVEKIEELSPAQIIVGDNPGLFNYGDNEAAFRQTGLMEAAKGYYKNLGNEMTAVKFHRDFMAQVGVSTDILEADIVISLPKFKTHGLTIITGAIKNSYGILPGAQKARLHQIAGSPERFHELVVHVFCLRIPDLFIMDAVIGMEGNGPASPDLRDIGLILAADNAVAMDSVMARMMGLDPKNLRFLQKAKELGLGDFDEKRIQTTDKIKVIPNFKLPPLSGKSIMDNPQIQDFMNQRASVIPRPDPQLCTACGDCIEHCPVGALEMGIEIPEADMSKCITCFCCQEICPEKAMILI
ncbi:MAG: DUF362 domain-containing protein [Proteobacteria bacterium]|nr:DUF362 domain-containing protein [Pseudomonadota bacterium]MBU1389079.1 DUF362 domain-containing protein [Pseudomonadota bacterium]MBU1543632.1 DUF362 domain-containing protein [Pseudomonadota bacterium]MBU2429439.1 DUF362 domain-containing protein [Pseudomonadota bacterium]MBU2479836.1 DUF362 domain-containing protein [Pseudomonadota bacterium]